MNQLKTILLISALTTGLSNAGTAPCNGFKIYFKNSSKHDLAVNNASFYNGVISSDRGPVIGVHESLMYTVNQSVEGGRMHGEFVFITPTEEGREMKLNFSLTNKNVTCEFADFARAGTLDASYSRVLGGVIVDIKA